MSGRTVSLHARDPAGVDPSGMDVIHGADPPLREHGDNDSEADPPIKSPPTSPAGPPPPTPRRAQAGNGGYGVRQPSPVMAFLVGDPPPPPPTPPPQKSRSSSTRRHRNGPISPPGDASTTTGFSSPSIHHNNTSQRGGHTPRDPLENHHVATTTSSSYVDQRRQEAYAIYESTDMYMEAQQQQHRYHQQEPELAPEPSFDEQKQASNKHLAGVESMESEDGPSNQPNSAASPRSAVTEPHSNKRNMNSRKHQESAENDSTGGSSSSSSKESHSNAANSAVPPKKRLGFGGGNTKERRGRGKSVERQKRGESQERGEKRGFFRKIFRGGKNHHKKAVELANEQQHAAEDMENLPPPPPPPPPPRREESATKVTFHNTSAGAAALEDPSVASKDTSASPLEVHTSHQKARPPTTKDHSSPSPGNRSNDMEDGLDLEGLDTVTSQMTNDMDYPERRDIFFAHDDVSTLTAPSAHSYNRRSIDPMDAKTVASILSSSEPVGHYWNDPAAKNAAESTTKKTTAAPLPTIGTFSQPSFQEPDGESPITSKKVSAAKSNHLKVDVAPVHQADPAGAAPRAKPKSGTHTNEPSPRGWESPVTKFRDPMGSTVSESNVKRPTSGFGREPTTQPNKLPPGQKRSLPHELRREPSAFRDGSPYALDPPLRALDGDVDTKSLADILSRTSAEDVNSDRSRVEPPTAVATDFHHQPPTPSERSERTAKVGGGFEPSPSYRAERTLPTLAQTIAERSQTTPGNAAQAEIQTTSVDNMSPNVARTTKVDSPDATGFLDDLFDEKPSRKRPSVLPATESESSLSTSPSNKQVAEIHRTQGLSKSPRSNKATPWNHDMVSEDVTPLPVPPKRNQPRSQGEEEKKEQDSPSFSGVDESKTNSITALSTAACMNAKTVAYLHTLNGEPSPRNSWGRPDLSDDEYSPVKTECQKKAVSSIKAAMSKKRAGSMCRTDEAAFDSFISSGPVKTSRAKKSSKALKTVEKPTLATSRVQFRSKYGALSPRSRKAARENFKRPVHWFRFNRDVRVSGVPLAYGLDLQRKKREVDILSGEVNPVRKAKKTRAKKKPSASPFKSLRVEDIKDPIQRAGVRLLTKAAIPIQSSARQYLARREASSRMQATLVLQSYFRRWKSEAFLRAYKHACTKIQAAFRSWSVREEVTYHHYNAIQIQKMVRGYIAAAYVYDTIYWVSRLQATMRGKVARLRFARLKQLRQRSALKLQAWNRGCIARSEARLLRMAVCTIQAKYRAHSAKIAYKVTIGNIVVAQSAARQFRARKEMQKRRSAKMESAACKIQATWRGFQGYTDYIFALVDILVLQRSMRKWLAIKKVGSMRRNQAAIKIQAQWRRQKALIGMLYDLVHIIIAQSVIRRFLAKKMLPQKRLEYSHRMREQQKLDSAATKIQTTWRGFWGYSHFIIMQYEIIRLQAIVRGRASRNLYSLKLGCCIMIQSAVRRFLANKRTMHLRIDQAELGAEVEGLRTKLACRRIQFWWRVVMECSREKKAALIIERFFLMVKAEVDKEIRRQSQVQAQAPPKRSRSKQSHQPANDADEKLLERVWLNTVDDNHIDVIACTSPSRETGGARNARSRSAPRLHQNPSYISAPSGEESPHGGVMHRSSSPSMNLVMRHEYDDQAKRRELELRARKEEALKASRRIQRSKQPQPPPDVTLARSDERTEVSAITSPTVFKVGKRSSSSKKKKSSKSKKFDDDMSVESLLGEDIVDRQKMDRQSAPNKWSQKQHFFSENSGAVKKHNAKEKRHSTSSIASGGSEGSLPHLYSRNATATTATRTTMESMSQSPSEQSECENTYVDVRTTDKYNTSAATKGKKLLESVRKGSVSTGRRSVSPRHGRIVVKNTWSDYPMLSTDDNVEVEYIGDQFGII